jgi:hypothetical protein
MKSIGLFSQIGAVLGAGVIGFYYVEPTITEIGVIQTDIAELQVERNKIAEINNTLNQKIATFESISRVNKEKLAVYMPRLIDDINVLRDITFIMSEAGVVNTGLAYDGAPNANTSVLSEDDGGSAAFGDQQPTKHSFTVAIEGSYTNIKEFLSLLEQNEYPLEVHELSLQADEFGDISASMILVTYTDDLVLVNDN